MNKKSLLTLSLSTVALLVVPFVSKAQTAEPVVAEELAPTGSVLPAKTLKVARQFNGALFGGKVLIGTVRQVADKVITVTQKDGTEADITTTEVTKFSKGGRKVNLAGLSVGDTVFALGASSTDGTFLAKAVVAKSKVLKELKKVPFYGTVGEVGVKSFTLSNQAKDETVEVIVNSTTVIKQAGKKVVLSAIIPGTRAVVIALKEDNGTYTGKMVQLLPETGPRAAAEKQSTDSGVTGL